jgi:hypothetical protein
MQPIGARLSARDALDLHALQRGEKWAIAQGADADVVSERKGFDPTLGGLKVADIE